MASGGNFRKLELRRFQKEASARSVAKLFFKRLFGGFVADQDDLPVFGEGIVRGRCDDGFLHVLNRNNAAPSLFSYIAILYGHTYEGGGGLLTENI